MSSDVLGKIREAGLIPVIRASSADEAGRIGTAMVDAGVAVLEITMTVPDAIAAISSAVRAFGATVIIGAGTVTTPEQANQAIDAGAGFLVTPTVQPAVIDAARRRAVPVIAGALTPTEIIAAINAGASWVKVFPASAVGGPAYIRSLRGPFPKLDLVPTGGVGLDTIDAYIKAGVAAVGVGGELMPRDVIARGDYAAITSLARQFIEALRRARGAAPTMPV